MLVLMTSLPTGKKSRCEEPKLRQYKVRLRDRWRVTFRFLANFQCVRVHGGSQILEPDQTAWKEALRFRQPGRRVLDRHCQESEHPHECVRCGWARSPLVAYRLRRRQQGRPPAQSCLAVAGCRQADHCLPWPRYRRQSRSEWARLRTDPECSPECLSSAGCSSATRIVYQGRSQTYSSWQVSHQTSDGS